MKRYLHPEAGEVVRYTEAEADKKAAVRKARAEAFREAEKRALLSAAEWRVWYGVKLGDAPSNMAELIARYLRDMANEAEKETT